MPCLNEAEGVGVCVEKALKALAEMGVAGEVVVVDNGSTDGSQEIAERAGARVVRLPTGPNGLVSLPALLDYLHGGHIRSLMVEGGATVISNFLAAHLADRLVLTIAPLMLGGLNAVADLGRLNGQAMPHLVRPRYQALGKDVVLFGELEWK